MSLVTLTLIGKPDCHLCETAEHELEQVLDSDRVRALNLDISVTRQSILDDEALAARYAEEIPVLLINGDMHSYWHIDPERLTTALEKLR